jgi:1-deoxy-D-xylulose-5-phosphate synthase
MTDGTGLTEFSKKFSHRFFDVGIAEEHAMTFSAGLAKGGLKPYFVVYSSFLQRSYDQIVHDVALSGLPVRILVDRAGFVGEDGKTHQGLFDVSFLSSVPGVTVFSPASFSELTGTIFSTKDAKSPVVIRYPRGTQPEGDLFDYSGKDFDIFNNNGTVAVVSYGRLSYNVFSAVNKTQNVDFIKLNKIFPLSDELIGILKKYKKVYIFEEGIKSGSIGEKLISALHINGYTGCAELTAVDSEFVSTASVQSQMEKYSLSEQSILNSIKE